MKTICVLLMLNIAMLITGCSEKPAEVFPGYAEAEYVRLSTPIAGTLLKQPFKKGDRVKRGATAFVLEQESERAARDEASFRVQQAQATLANLKKGKRPDEVAAAQAQLAQAEAALRLTSADLARQTKLLNAHFIAAARLDEARAAVERDQGRIKELQAQLRVQQLAGRSDEIDAAEQALKAAQAQLAQVEWRVAQKNQIIPVDGDVADVLFQEGEWVPAGSPVLSLLPEKTIKARFFVAEVDLGRIRLGQGVTLHCDGCSAPIAAKIVFISHDAEYTAPLIYSKENRSTLVFMVEARPDLVDAYRLHPGQPLEVRLVTADAKGKS
jgi:HlyD family secretion protein